MKRAIALTAVLAFVLGASARASQAKPNFAGKWAIVPDAAAGAGGGMMTPAAMTVTQDDKALVVTSTSAQMGEMKTPYNLDGTEAKAPIDFQGNSLDRVTKSKWDGNKLALTATSNFNGQAFEVVQVWSLGADGSLLIETTRPDFQGGGAPVTTKATYKKS